MVAPVDVVVWASLGSLVAALSRRRHRERCFRSRVLELSRVLVVGTLTGIALSALALSLAPHWTVTNLLSSSDRWALAFVVGALAHRFWPIALSVLQRLAHDPANKV